jgi:serine/threonine protein kinase
MAQLVEALGWIHRNPGCPLVHGDVKLENILVTGERNGPIVKICDFGLCVKMTASSVGAGTPAYKSPVWLENGSDSNDPADDIYALGTKVSDRRLRS